MLILIGCLVCFFLNFICGLVFVRLMDNYHKQHARDDLAEITLLAIFWIPMMICFVLIAGVVKIVSLLIDFTFQIVDKLSEVISDIVDRNFNDNSH
jgi:uncharacterized membrane protein